MYVLDEADYDGWFGLDLFPYRDVPRKFIELSRDNLCLAKRVVDLMNEKGARDLRASGTHGPELAALTRDCIMQTKQPHAYKASKTSARLPVVNLSNMLNLLRSTAEMPVVWKMGWPDHSVGEGH